MAYSLNSRFNNAVVGQMMAGADVDIYKINSKAEYPVGQGFERSDGARFRYAHAGAATNRGVIVAQDFDESSVADTDNAVIAPSATYQQNDEPNGTYPGSVNSRYVLMTLAGAAIDQYAGGYLSITDDAGEGYTYRIRGNDATDTTATGKVLLSLYDKLQVALTATTDVAITGPMFANLEAAGTDTDGLAVGVSCASLTATDPYGWIQTRGIATVLCDTAGTAGNMAIVSQSVAGSYRAAYTTTATGNYPTIGYIVTPGDTNGHGVINLMLE
jgi:hypothetical protein